MAKTRIRKPYFTVGLEYDSQAIRGARLAADGLGGYAVHRLEEIRGDFAEDEKLIQGLKLMRDKLAVAPRDLLVACLSGKQVFASQITFRRLPPEEMEPALRLELRKNVHFEVAGATLDYLILTEGEAKGEPVQVLVALTAQGVLDRQLRALERAEMKPTVVDVLPVAVANALWAFLDDTGQEYPQAALHVGPQIATIVLDGGKSPFFHRNIYFSAQEISAKGGALLEKDREKRIQALADEVSRSLQFYEKNSLVSGFEELHLLGEYLDIPGLKESLGRHTGLATRVMDIPTLMGFDGDSQAGRFDLAVALATRENA